MVNEVIITAEVVSMVFVVLILMGVRLGLTEKTKKTKVYMVFLATEVVALICDTLSYAGEGRIKSDSLLTLITFFSFAMIDVLLAIYAYYIVLVVNKHNGGTMVFAWLIMLISGVNIILALIGTINGKLFLVENGRYVYGTWRDTRAYLPLISVVILWVMIVKNIKAFERSYIFPICMYAAVPVVDVISVLVFSEYDFSYVLSAIAGTSVFIFAQKEEVLEAKIREQLISRMSREDALTGLMNRRGYDELIEKRESGIDTGVVFCDLNALKYVNDAMGHAAGDAYIKKFAGILREVYKDNCAICRISGDEFVVLTAGIDRKRFSDMTDRIKALIEENSGIASVGTAYGNAPILELVSKAEKEMYEDKRQYHEKAGYSR